MFIESNGSYNRILDFIRKFFTDEDSRARLFFILLSVFLWFLIKLSKEGYTETISFPIQYGNLPEDRVMLNPPPPEVQVTLRTQGFNLLAYKFRRFRKIRVNVKEIERTASSGHSYWLTNNNLAFVENQFDEETDILNISPDTIHFEFSKLESKKVPVVFNFQKNFTNEIAFQKEPVLSPDSILISGAKAEVDRIKSVSTERTVLDAQKDSVQLKVALDLKRDNVIKYSEKFVEVNINYTKLTQGKQKIPIAVSNLPDSLEIVTFPRQVELSYNVAIENYEKINEADFNVTVDFNQIKENKEVRYLRLKAESYTGLVSNLSIEPKQVEFIITRR